MMRISRWKAAAIPGARLLGLLPSIPKPIPRPDLAAWLPGRQVTLGLDLWAAPACCSSWTTAPWRGSGSRAWYRREGARAH
jgi:hypothetical protein